MSNFNKTQFKAILVESVFDPKIKGPYSIILESSTSDYLILRTVEILRESISLTGKDRDDKVKLAISLLGMSRLLGDSNLLGENNGKGKNPKQQSKTKRPKNTKSQASDESAVKVNQGDDLLKDPNISVP